MPMAIRVLHLLFTSGTMMLCKKHLLAGDPPEAFHHVLDFLHLAALEVIRSLEAVSQLGHTPPSL